MFIDWLLDWLTDWLIDWFFLFFVYYRSINLEGHGVIQSLGGDGYSGGAGGRVAVYLDTLVYFHGTYQSLGGDGNGHYLSQGGPGSVYIHDIRFESYFCC